MPTIPPFTPGNPTATPLGSDITDPNFTKGVAAYQAKNYKEVISLMNAVIKTSPGLAPPYRYRGMAYWYLQDCKSGLVDVEKALAIKPDYAVARADRGLMKECLGDEKQALQDYQKALSLDPSLAFVHQNLGVYYYGKKDYEKALEEYSLSAAIDPNRSGAWGGKSEALRELGRFEECVVSASQSIQIDQKAWLSYMDRAYCEAALKNYDGAIQDFQVYAQNTPNDPTAWQNVGVAYGHRGNVYYASGRYYDAIADYEMAVKLIRGDARSFCGLAHSYFATQQYEKAMHAAKSSMAIGPACARQDLFELEGRSAYALGNYDQAIGYMDQALAESQYPLGYYYRGISYQAAGNKQEAIRDLKRFLTHGPTGKEADDARARLAKLGSDEVGSIITSVN